MDARRSVGRSQERLADFPPPDCRFVRHLGALGPFSRRRRDTFGFEDVLEERYGGEDGVEDKEVGEILKILSPLFSLALGSTVLCQNLDSHPRLKSVRPARAGQTYKLDKTHPPQPQHILNADVDGVNINIPGILAGVTCCWKVPECPSGTPIVCLAAKTKAAQT